MAAARSPPVNYGFAPEQAKRFREFEAKHMATLYPAQLSLHKTESTMTGKWVSFLLASEISHTQC